MPINEHTVSTLSVGHAETLVVQVTPEDVAKFAAISGDVSPLHVDEEYAKGRGFGGCVAHGMLIGAYVSALIGTKLPGKHGIMQSSELTFRAPLVPPDTLTIAGEVSNVSEGTGQITIKITVKNLAGRTLTTGVVKSIIRA